MYEIVKFAGFFVRQLFLPNPFETMWPEEAFFINLIAGAVLMLLTYFLTGLWYRRGDGAAIASIIFNFVYIVLSLTLWGIIELIEIVTDNWVITILIVGVVILIALAVAIAIRQGRKKSDQRAERST